MSAVTTRDTWRDLLALPELDLGALDPDALPGAVSAAPVDVPTRAMGHAADADHVWRVLDAVLDPEVPVVSIRELGIVREVRCEGEHVSVVLTPTYSGCPATEMIEAMVRDALDKAGYEFVTVSYRRAPAWTTDWISDEGRRKLHQYGIAPPAKVLCGACATGGEGGAGISAETHQCAAHASPIQFVVRGPADRGPTDRGPTDRGLSYRAPADRDPIERGATDRGPPDRGPNVPAPVACPRCGSAQTERLSAFGSTACKSLYRCIACREPFEYFKPI